MTVLHKRADTHNSLGDSGTRTRSGRRGGSLTWRTARRPASRNGRGRRSTPYTRRPNARLQRSGSRRATRSPRSAPRRNAMPPRRSSRWQASLAGRKMPLPAPCHPHAAPPAATADLPPGPASRLGQVPQARERDDSLPRGACGIAVHGSGRLCVPHGFGTAATRRSCRPEAKLVCGRRCRSSRVKSLDNSSRITVESPSVATWLS